LDRAAKACKTLSIYDDGLRNALRIQGLNLEKQIDELNNTLKDNIAFFNASISKDISGTSSDHKANTVAKFVAAVFLALGRPVSLALKRTILVNPQHLLEEPFETHLSCSKYTESQQRLI